MLGRDWKLWQAFRELHSNALDEGGDSFRETFSGPTPGDTTIVVYGNDFENTYDEKDSIFLSGKPHYKDSFVEIHRATRITRGKIFYRNVRVHEIEQKVALFTYNVKASMVLTEDRTVASTYQMNSAIANMIVCRCESAELINDLLSAKENNYEYTLPYNDCWGPSTTFLEVLMERYMKGKPLPPSAEQMARDQKKKREETDTIELSKMQDARLSKAIDFLLKAGFRDADLFTIKAIAGTELRIEGDRIFIPIKTFDAAPTLAGQLVLACIHKECFDAGDNSYESQLSTIAKKLITVIGDATGEYL